MSKTAEYIQKQLIKEFVAQGHSLTGAAEKSLRYEKQVTPNGFTITGYGKGFLRHIETGVKWQNIPFRQGSGAGKSDFIDGLRKYAELRFMLSGKKALGAAFAMAYKMKGRDGNPGEGMSTKKAYKHSSTGERHNFITIVLKRERNVIKQMVAQEMGTEITGKIKNMFTKYTDKL